MEDFFVGDLEKFEYLVLKMVLIDVVLVDNDLEFLREIILLLFSDNTLFRLKIVDFCKLISVESDFEIEKVDFSE